MEITPFELDIVPDVDQDGRIAMGNVIFAFARLDSMVSHLVFLAFHLSLSEGPILLGAMDTKTKLDRLKQLYDHHQMLESAQNIANLKAAHHHYSDIRNTIAHSTCSGTRISNRELIVFAPVKIAPKMLEHIPIKEIEREGMRRAAIFAKDAADRIYNAIGDLVSQPAKPPPEPPSFPPLIDPTQDKKGGGKQGKRRGVKRGK